MQQIINRENFNIIIWYIYTVSLDTPIMVQLDTWPHPPLTGSKCSTSFHKQTTRGKDWREGSTGRCSRSTCLTGLPAPAQTARLSSASVALHPSPLASASKWHAGTIIMANTNAYITGQKTWISLHALLKDILALSYTCHVEDRAKCHALAGNVNGINFDSMSYIHVFLSSVYLRNITS